MGYYIFGSIHLFKILEGLKKNNSPENNLNHTASRLNSLLNKFKYPTSDTSKEKIHAWISGIDLGIFIASALKIVSGGRMQKIEVISKKVNIEKETAMLTIKVREKDHNMSITKLSYILIDGNWLIDDLSIQHVTEPNVHEK